MATKKATTTKVDQTDSPVLLLPDRNRDWYHILNDSTATLTIRLGEEPTGELYLRTIAPGGAWGDELVSYDGPVYGVWDASGSGAARITELRS